MKILFVFCFSLVVSLSVAQQGWFKQESGTQETLRRVQFFNATNGWICGDTNAYHTTDAGEHWTLFMPPPLHRYFYFIDEATAIAVGRTPDGNHSTVIRTSDMGQTWSELYQDAKSTVRAATHIGDTVFVVYDGFLLRSIDRGENWERIDFTSFAYMNAIVFKDHKNGFMAGRRGIFTYTVDGGNTWGQKPTGLADDIELHDIDILSNNTIFIVGGSRTLLFSDNLGNSWNTIPKLDQFKESYKAIAFSDNLNGVVVGSRGFIYRTTDGGIVWKTQVSGVPIDTPVVLFLRDVYMADSLNAWAVGDGGAILHTTDAGKSWVRQYLPDLESLHSQVYPQPFATKTTISYELPKAGKVTVRIYDGLGRELQTTTSLGIEDAGWHSVEFDGSAYSDEVFYYRIEAYPYVGTGKFTKVAF
jgi:photosystem II stability/assembly factor-like uncharacterized protein